MGQTQQNHPSSDFGAGARAVLMIAEQAAAALEATPGFSTEREGYAVAALRGLIRAGERLEKPDTGQRTLTIANPLQRYDPRDQTVRT